MVTIWIMYIIDVLAIYESAAIASEDFGEFTVLHSPNYLNFLHTSDAIDASEISSLVAAYLGLPMNTVNCLLLDALLLIMLLYS